MRMGIPVGMGIGFGCGRKWEWELMLSLEWEWRILLCVNIAITGHAKCVACWRREEPRYRPPA